MPSFISIDVETANSDFSSICQVGIARFLHGELVETFSTLIDPETFFMRANIGIHGIDSEMVKGAPKFFEAFEKIDEYLSSGVVSSHSYFDRTAINRAIDNNFLSAKSYHWIDATRIIRAAWPQYSKRGYGLGNLSQDFGIEFKHHDACEDARVSGELMCRAIKDSGIGFQEWLEKIAPKPRKAKNPAIVADMRGI